MHVYGHLFRIATDTHISLLTEALLVLWSQAGRNVLGRVEYSICTHYVLCTLTFTNTFRHMRALTPKGYTQILLSYVYMLYI